MNQMPLETMKEFGPYFWISISILAFLIGIQVGMWAQRKCGESPNIVLGCMGVR